jgi:(S)-2-hydroxyglutarate dehydrogenase
LVVGTVVCEVWGVTNEYRYGVVGAGIVGLATAYHLQAADPAAPVVVIEAEDEVGTHQTGHNSGVIHSGIYYEPASLKARFCKAGERATKEFCRRHGIRFAECGKLIVATNSAEVSRMDALQRRAEVNGIAFRRLGRGELAELEPNVIGLGALYLPATGIVDYPDIARTLADLVAGGGGSLCTGSPVVEITETATGVVVTTGRESVTCDGLIVCGGLQSDRLAEMAGLAIDVQIIPFRGEYYRLPATRSGFVQRLIYPVPDPELPFLGVHLSPTIHGDITVGPSAVLGLARQGYPRFSVNLRDAARMAMFPGMWHVARNNVGLGLREIRNSLLKGSYLRECRKYAPALQKSDLLPHGAGIRAQAVRRDGTLVHDFVIERTARMIHVLNSPSPAATAALPIGEHLANLAVTA